MNSEVNWSKKSDPKTGIWPILAAVFLVITLALSILYFLEIRSSNKLKNEIETLSNRSTTVADTEPATVTPTPAAPDTTNLDKLNQQIKTLTQEKTTAETAKTTAETAKTAADAAKTTAENALALANSNQAIVLKYNDVLAYIIDIVDTHNGFDGITDAEFNATKVLAEKTGDVGLTTKLDWAWTEIAVDSIERLVQVLDYIQGKMATKLQ